MFEQQYYIYLDCNNHYFATGKKIKRRKCDICGKKPTLMFKVSLQILDGMIENTSIRIDKYNEWREAIYELLEKEARGELWGKKMKKIKDIVIISAEKSKKDSLYEHIIITADMKNKRYNIELPLYILSDIIKIAENK